MKFATRPKNIPIGATKAIISNKKKVDIFFLIENQYVPMIIPTSAPWKDIPPSQTLRISNGFDK